jgi:signal peptidase I
LPGDRIAMHEGRLWINGAPVGLKADGSGQAEAEDGSSQPVARFVETLPGDRDHTIFKRDTFGMFDEMQEITIPPGRLFVMGDNRDNSADSRVPLDAGGVGLLPVSDLVGRVDALVGSWDLGIRSEPLWRWPTGFRASRFFTTVQ